MYQISHTLGSNKIEIFKILQYIHLVFIILVQARMGSLRFPGKSLTLLQGKPLLSYLVESIIFSTNCQPVILTSTAPEDNAIADFCTQNKIQCMRGDMLNVALRFYQALERLTPDYFVRINGDSPLLDARTIKTALEHIGLQHEAPQYKDVVDNPTHSQKKPWDIVSTVPSYPSGMNVEVVHTHTFIEEFKNFNEPGDFEHVTPYFYRNHSRFQILRLPCPAPNVGEIKFSLDTQADKARLERLLSEFKQPHYHYTLEEKCHIYRKLFVE